MPELEDIHTQMPLSSANGKLVRSILQYQIPNVPVAFVNALGCFGEADKIDDEEINACRKYVLHALRVIKPTKVICMGSIAARSIVRHAADPMSVTGGYGFIEHYNGGNKPLPVWFAPTPYQIGRNRIVREQFRSLVTAVYQWKWGKHHGAHFGAETVVVTNEQDAAQVYAHLLSYGDQADSPYRVVVSVDVETYRPAFRGQIVISLALSWYEGDKIKSAVWDTEGLDPLMGGVDTLCEILTDPRIGKVAHNGKFDQHALIGTRMLPAFSPYIGDTRLLCKMLNTNASAALDSCNVLVGMGGHKGDAHAELDAIRVDLQKLVLAQQLTPAGKARKPYTPKFIDAATVPQDILDGIRDKTIEIDSVAYRWLNPRTRIIYNARDTAATIKLWRDKEPELTEGQRAVMEEVVMPATHALVQMEQWGLPVSLDMLGILEMHVEMALMPVQCRLSQYDKPDAPFNPGSRPQVLALFEQLNLVPKGKTKTGGVSVDDKALEPLKSKHIVVGDILEYRRLSKVRGTYIEGVRNAVCPDGRIHATCLLDGAGTGRTSYQNPNLQNWPRASDDSDKPEGLMLRSCVVAPPGWTLVEIDQSQIEIRVAAALSQDPEMLQIIHDGRDFHSATAELIYGPNFTDEQRTASKTCIAEGQLVLTDTGLKPIETVGVHDLVWDGMAWVSHAGVVFQGERDVIEYAGLTATPDHLVFTTEGGTLPFGAAASRLEGRRLAIGGNGVVPAGYAYPHGAHRAGGKSADEVSGGNMLSVPRHLCSVRVQHPPQEDHRLCLPEGGEVQQRPEGDAAGTAVLSNGPAVQSPAVRLVQELRWARHPAPVRVSRDVHSLGLGEPSAPNVQGGADRSDQQRRALRAGQPSARHGCGEPAQLQGEPLGGLLRGAACGCRCIPGHCARISELQALRAHSSQSCSQMGSGGHSSSGGSIRCGDGCVRRVARVYDITNAGPRNRFTVSGYVVSNCNFSLIYEIPENIGYLLSKSLSAKLKRDVSRDEAQEIADKIFGRYKRLKEWMREQHHAGLQSGGAYTIWRGKPARFRPLPDLGLADDPRNPHIKQAKETAIRSTWNGPIQGTSSDLTIAALHPTVQWIVQNKIPAELMVTIHDSLLGMVRNDYLDQYISVVKAAMTQHQGWLGVPLVADAKIGKHWGSMKKYIPGGA
jgi:DNA polymerase I-like protein with 3'-5' exonuclease and polymerase domains